MSRTPWPATLGLSPAYQWLARRLALALLVLLGSLMLLAVWQATQPSPGTYPPLVAPSPPGPFDLQMHDRLELGFVGIEKMSEMPANRDLSRATHPELYAYLEAYGMHVRQIGWTASSVAAWLTEKQPFWRINAVGRLLMKDFPKKYRYFESTRAVDLDTSSPILQRPAPAAPAFSASVSAATYPPLVAPSPPGRVDLQMHDRIGLGFVGIEKMSEMPANRDLSRATHPELYAYLEAYGMHVRQIGWAGASVALWLTEKQPLWRINAVGRLLMQAYPHKYSYFESDEFVEFDLRSPISPRRAPANPASAPSATGMRAR